MKDNKQKVDDDNPYKSPSVASFNHDMEDLVEKLERAIPEIEKNYTAYFWNGFWLGWYCNTVVLVGFVLFINNLETFVTLWESIWKR